MNPASEDQPFMLTVERLRELHAEGLRRWKGKPGEVDPYSGCLESVVGGARTALGYHDAPVSDAGLTYASFLLQKAATRHCMNDGNKRLAWLACVESVLMMDGRRRNRRRGAGFSRG